MSRRTRHRPVEDVRERLIRDIANGMERTFDTFKLSLPEGTAVALLLIADVIEHIMLDDECPSCSHEEQRVNLLATLRNLSDVLDNPERALAHAKTRGVM